ncbi:MAG: nickel-dependent hydrogenase large subunit [candidate division KSB1 bacterium]|nr:nickel-dependent hydrogenase large subunit [candidate division KSB1 bacterium]MDZ7274116.1 nickel-dependent hydrogenase large subunit [candidate division KSB1 bacterium]MDZ7287840.1 nickel-dependent hydrogenase large subunit [candidate division KSB1 bacterium]MDZ7296714.1 nickel-dependent hydrogenase large subunit [candidate division KSB1 bacterium]MDZ7347580.1 nickel-dependent hydrogenase large subunit [candidate division KSB1 bacterium]
MARIVVDPITRIEGHLRIEAVVENGRIAEAYSSGTMVRGFEKILKGRDPRDAWAFTERACGVCTTVHALASVRTVEDALGITVPKNAELIRNLMCGAQYVQDHVVHFYHLHALDWVDVVSALSADPAATAKLAQSLSPWPKSSPGYFADLQKRLQTFVASGQLGIFANGYWGHPQYKLPPEVNLMAVAHYLEALEWQKEIVKVHTIFGGKNPHPNYLVGGVPCSINLDEVNAINTERLNHVAKLIADAIVFVEQVYLPDLLAIAGFYKDWAAIGGGLTNYLAYGEFPTRSYNQPDSFKFPRGAILNRNLNEVHEVNGRDREEIKEYISHSWYSYNNGDGAGLHPWDGETEFNFTGPKPPFQQLNVEGKYSWLKTPRWKDHAMEVGPLARLLVAYAKGVTEVREIVNDTLHRLAVPVTALFSTLGRTAARGLETRLVVHWMQEFYDELVANVKAGETRTFTDEKWDPATWPETCEGVGMSEAPRGALAHWIRIKDKKIDNYQLVVPSTWNASPKDHRGQRSAYEESLLGTPVANVDQPVEILRTIHSFDPCIACAVHLYDPAGRQVHRVKFY